MKRISAIILAVCLMLICGTSAIAASPPETEKVALSDMTSDELAQFLQAQDIEVPDCYLDYIMRIIPKFEKIPIIRLVSAILPYI